MASTINMYVWDRFVKEMRKVKKRKSGEKGPPVQSLWKYFETMMFLQDSVKHYNSFFYSQFISILVIMRLLPI